MKIKLPIQHKEIKDDKLVKTLSEKEFELDTSLASQIRFEAKFPLIAQNEDLFEYSKRICAVEGLSASLVISKMKILYCYLETDIDYIEFLKMFDLSDLEYTKKLTDKMTYVFELVFNGSAEKN